DRLAAALIALSKFEEAGTVLTRALSIREQQSEQAPLGLAATLELVGWLNPYKRDYRAGTAPPHRALDLRSRFSPHHPATITALGLRGALQWMEGAMPVARGPWQDALARAEATLNPEHPTTAGLLRRQAMAARLAGDADQERRLLERGLQMTDRFAPCHP